MQIVGGDNMTDVLLFCAKNLRLLYILNYVFFWCLVHDKFVY